MKNFRNLGPAYRAQLAPYKVLMCALLFILLTSLACNAPSSDTELQDTQVALNIQATLLAEGEQPAEPVASPDTATPTRQAEESQPGETPSQTPQPVTATPTASLTPQPSNTPQPTATDPPAPPASASLDELIQGSKILLFEDITSVYATRYVKEALDNLGLSTNYVDVKDAVGHFKTQLLSGTDWDLIITSVEARSNVQGEFFTYLNDQLNDGTSVIIEHWNLDDLSRGQASSILSRCGIRISDWYDPPDTNRSLWPLQGEHPIFHQPNENISLTNYTLYWFGDVGDLMRVDPGSEAVLLAGLFAQYKDSNGTLASCLDDRLILQTFSTHDYRQDQMVHLWQNYIYNALRAHFEYTGELP
ncbi:MAG: hypothetical protein JW862_01900 [Anaerolineales bacterium]|nr:hypothetical protein [Anaerolineales bacterium]